MDLVAPVKQLFARLRGLVVEAVTERMRALPEGGTLDVEDVQARASASLAVLSVVDANFDTLSLPSMLMSRIQELPLQWPDISARLAEASAAGRFVEVEAIMLAVLRDARVDALIKASISDVEKCSEIILSDVSNSVSALLPVDKKDLVSVEPAFAASTSSTVFGLDDLMRMSDGPSFTDLEDLVAAVTRKDAKVSNLRTAAAVLSVFEQTIRTVTVILFCVPSANLLKRVCLFGFFDQLMNTRPYLCIPFSKNRV